MGNSASSLPFAIGKQVSTLHDGWALHDGSRKSDAAAVTVFVAKKPALHKTLLSSVQRSNNKKNSSNNSNNLTQLEPALHHFQNCKRLRHPHILQVYATLDTDHPADTTGAGGGGSGSSTGPAGPNPASSATATTSAPTTVTTGDLIVVTEPCVSLDAWLQTRPPPDQIAWGLESIVRAVHFLHTSANQVHGNLSPESIYVTPAGDVKLWNFSLVCSFAAPGQGGSGSGSVPRYFRETQGLLTPAAYQAPERQEGRWDAIAMVGVHAMDSYGMGVLMGHFYQGNVPALFTKAVQRLLTTNIKMRPRLQPLLKCPIFNTPYQKFQLQLEELSIQPAEQKVAFWQNLVGKLETGLVPKAVAVYKLLPIMKSSIEIICQTESLRSQSLYRREVLAILQPLFYVAENFLEDSFAAELTTVIGLLFAVADRGVRGALLQKAVLFSNNMDKNSLNSAVFEPMCSGFSDSSAALRELTLKATLVLVPHLTQPNLEKLSRYLVRLQADPEASIRTNTVIFFSKLTPYLTDSTRQKLLLPAFTRALKDPFKPCRLAALQSTLKAKEYFDPKGVASKVLPVVTPQLLDPAREVRREAFAAVDDLLFYLRQESERMNALPEPDAGGGNAPPTGATHARTTSAAAAAAKATAPPVAPSSGGWGISSWMSTSKTAGAAPVAVTAAPATVPLPPRTVIPAVQSTGMALSNGNTGYNDTVDADGWDDDGLDDDLDDDGLDLSSGGVRGPALVGGSLITPKSPVAGGFNNDDDFFGSFDAKPAKPAATMRSSGSGGKLAVPTRKTKPIVSVKKLAVDDVEDGWDDF